jgi:hypothetical protein
MYDVGVCDTPLQIFTKNKIYHSLISPSISLLKDKFYP